MNEWMNEGTYIHTVYTRDCSDVLVHCRGFASALHSGQEKEIRNNCTFLHICPSLLHIVSWGSVCLFFVCLPSVWLWPGKSCWRGCSLSVLCRLGWEGHPSLQRAWWNTAFAGLFSLWLWCCESSAGQVWPAVPGIYSGLPSPPQSLWWTEAVEGGGDSSWSPGLVPWFSLCWGGRSPPHRQQCCWPGPCILTRLPLWWALGWWCHRRIWWWWNYPGWRHSRVCTGWRVWGGGSSPVINRCWPWSQQTPVLPSSPPVVFPSENPGSSCRWE